MMHVVREYEERLNSIEAELEELNTEMDKLRELEEYHRILRKSFFYGQKPLTYEQLGEPDFTTNKIKLKREAPENLENKLEEILTHVKKLDEELFISNVERLIKKYSSISGADPHIFKPQQRLDFGWAEEVGDLPLGRWSTRVNVYNYWADIHDKYDVLVEATDTFLEKVKEVHKGIFDELSSEDFQEQWGTFYEQANEFIQWWKENKVPNYVLQLKQFELKTPSNFASAVNLLNHYHDLLGVMESNDIEKADYISAEELGRRIAELPVVPERPELSEDLKMPEQDIEMVDVDPIFHYEYQKDYSELKIPKEDIGKIRNVIDGIHKEAERVSTEELTEGKHVTGKWNEKIMAGLKHVWLDEEDLDEFDDWFDNFIDMIKETDEKEKGLFLPLSKFISDYKLKTKNDILIKDEITQKELDEIDELTLEYLDYIVKFTEVATEKKPKTSFSVRQERRGTGGKGGGAIAEWFHAGRRGESSKFIEGTEKRKEIKENDINNARALDKSWNDLLKAINEYYLLPLQGKYFVQAREKPKWAIGHSSLLLSIKNAKDNPLGSLLDRIVDDGLQGFTPDDVDNIRKFIDSARTSTHVSDLDDLFKLGKKAVEGLDSFFGEGKSGKWHNLNEESIGYIIYDKAMKFHTQDIGERAKEHRWDDIEDNYRRYKNKSKTTTYPIDQLRHALNTPEFTAWAGISKGRTEQEKKPSPYIDPDLRTAIVALDKTFDSFHKMDEINESLLYAHDTIRKMKKQPIIHSNLSLDYISHMDIIINKIEKEQKMDLTATEINKIVKSVSSYESLAKNFGINEEAVYTVKAMFR